MKSIDKLREVAAKTERANGRCGDLYRGDLERLADKIDDEGAANYVALPVDADGVPIHFGDKVNITTTVVCTVTQLRYVNGKWQVGCTCENCMNYYSPQSIRHAKSDSWEQIIMDALKEGYDRKEFLLMSESRVSTADLVARCKALAGEE